MTATTAITLGRGTLDWPRHERVSDRYGLVTLLKRVDADGTVDFGAAPIDEVGRLVATVRGQRRSHHIGDLFRGLRPPDTPPAIGSVHVLGEGTLFRSRAPEGWDYVGLRPDDGRTSDWLDPRVLYTLHSQVVDLAFERTGSPAADGASS